MADMGFTDRMEKQTLERAKRNVLEGTKIMRDVIDDVERAVSREGLSAAAIIDEVSSAVSRLGWAIGNLYARLSNAVYASADMIRAQKLELEDHRGETVLGPLDAYGVNWNLDCTVKGCIEGTPANKKLYLIDGCIEARCHEHAPEGAVKPTAAKE